MLQTQIRPTPTPTSTPTSTPQPIATLFTMPTLTSQPTKGSAFSHNLVFFAVGLTPTLLVFLAVTFYIKKKKIDHNIGKV
jgi:hypothetical protein